jgi:SAM-dependent methyltransferase
MNTVHFKCDTVQYFDQYTPEYDESRYNFIINYINKLKTGTSSLLDVGCGTGNILAMIQRECGIADLHGMDLSSSYLDQAGSLLDCRLHLGSVLDRPFLHSLNKRFSFVILGAVLHHLVGNTRKASRLLALHAIANCLDILDTDGYLFVHEPTFTPAVIMDLVFHIKRIVTRTTKNRVSVFGNTWNNLGAPVVSYYSKDELCGMVNRLKGEILETHQNPTRLPLIFKIGLIRKSDTTIVVKKRS